MESVSRLVFFLPLILSIAFANNVAPAAAAADLISKTCGNAVNKQLCVKTLQADPASTNADGAGLAAIAVNLALANATVIFSDVKKLLPAAKVAFEKQCLTDCAENYETAVGQLKDSLGALKTKKYDDATTWIQAAMTDSESCEEGFTERPGLKNPLAEKSTLFQQLCGNALAIVNTLAGM
ncbi:hypothetical protein IFM89_030048 [Coptis chinensis]|uniref:Pectinesterase inhibitor domain-containing protein n=1 Tax=Coptis chinensis TaxID=261450 RepID=A0A835INF3_9MAGN|nr:hypothetical protein IFM89_030048 [Coptis chinensis]